MSQCTVPCTQYMHKVTHCQLVPSLGQLPCWDSLMLAKCTGRIGVDSPFTCMSMYMTHEAWWQVYCLWTVHLLGARLSSCMTHVSTTVHTHIHRLTQWVRRHTTPTTSSSPCLFFLAEGASPAVNTKVPCLPLGRLCGILGRGNRTGTMQMHITVCLQYVPNSTAQPPEKPQWLTQLVLTS